MFWIGLVMGMMIGACLLAFLQALFYLAKQQSDREKKWHR